MMKKKLFLFTLLGFALLSCNKDDEIVKVETGSIENKDYQKVAELLSSIELDLTVCNEVHEAVNKSLDFGLDEEYRFKEILDETNQKITTRSSSILSLGSRLKEYISNQPTTRSEGTPEIDADLLIRIAQTDMQIYWPYSEDWDGKTMPVITFVPENEEQEWNYGYKRVNSEDGSCKIETIIVDEKYAENNPVWIVNNSDTPYDKLPEFTKGENVNASCYFVPRSIPSLQEDIHNDELQTIETRSGTKRNVYTVRLGKLKSHTQHDSFWSGGSEFIIKMGAIDGFVITSAGQLNTSSVRVTETQVNRSRKDIKKKRWADVNVVLSSHWQPQEQNAGFLIIEEDGGKKREYETDLETIWEGKNYKYKAKMTYKKNDDIIYKTTYSRDFIFSTNNNLGNDKWEEHTSRGVYWTLPYKIGQVLH